MSRVITPYDEMRWQQDVEDRFRRLEAHDPNGPVVNVYDFGAIGDGESHLLSEFFADLAQAQGVYSFVTSLDEEIDWAAWQAAVNSGFNVWGPRGDFMISSSIDMRGISDRVVFGDGMHVTRLICTADLDGSDQNTKNDVFNLINFVDIGAYMHDVTIRDMTIDCTLMNASALSPGTGFGRNLCAIEFQNVDYARAERVHVIKAFGNAIVSASIDPGMDGAVKGATVKDCLLEDCVQGVLPQYEIAGSVMQFGAMLGGEISGNQIIRAGGPWVDWFNCRGTSIHHNYIKDVSSTAVATGQTVASAHSDFGLVGCTYEANIHDNSGPIFFNGLMVPVFFNDMVPTQGPFGCSIKDNILIGTGNTPMAAPAYGSATNPMNVPALVKISGAPSAVTIDGNPAFGSGQNSDQYIVPAGANITPTGGTSWTWRRAPNATTQHIIIASGNASGYTPGFAYLNTIEGNFSWLAPGPGIRLYDNCYGKVIDNTIVDAAEWSLAYVFEALDTQTHTGASHSGTQFCTFADNFIVDSRTNKRYFGNYFENTEYCLANVFQHNRVEKPAEGADTYVLGDPDTGFMWRDNYGPGVPLIVPTINAANTMLLPNTSDVFIVDGSTLIVTIIALGQAGRRVKLMFNSVCAISNNGDNITIPGTEHYYSQPGDVLDLTCDGVGWHAVPPTPTGYLTGTGNWDPGEIEFGYATTMTVTVPNAKPGDTAIASISEALPAGCMLTAAVNGLDSVGVTMMNMSGSAHNIGFVTVRVDVFQH